MWKSQQLSPQTHMYNFCCEWALCHWGHRWQRNRRLASAATGKAEGSCPNRLLAAASAKIHIPNRCFTPASPSTSCSFQFKSGWSASDWKVLVAIHLGNATFASLMLAGWVDPSPESQDGCWESWSMVSTADHPLSYSTFTRAILCVAEVLTNNSNILLWHNTLFMSNMLSLSSKEQTPIPLLIAFSLWWRFFSIPFWFPETQT